MKKLLISCLFLSALLIIVCSLASDKGVTFQSFNLYDQARKRPIPIYVYFSQQALNKSKPTQPLSVAIVNHGYTVSSKEYSFIANSLVSSGYFVVSIQHDLENDPKLPITGKLYQKRKPLWDRGVQNILFVMNELMQNPKLNFNKIILIGHSNGGDISMLFATLYPNRVLKVISLDSLRMPFPNNNVKILNIRASDTTPDPGVISKNAQSISIDAKHIDLCDRGSIKTQQNINRLILDFVNQ